MDGTKLRPEDAATQTFAENLTWLSRKNQHPHNASLPEGATQISMYQLFPLPGNPMSDAWNSPDGTIALKTVVEFARYLVDEHEVNDETRLTLELLLQAIPPEDIETRTVQA